MNAVAKTEQYTVTLSAYGYPTVKVPVPFIDHASATVRAFIESNGLGSSKLKAGCGDVRDSKGKVAARISYNGRMWKPDGTELVTA